MRKTKKLYKTCLLVGRFQPFHIGHFKMIKKALNFAETVLVLIGSANEPETERNPFSYKEREEMIAHCFKNGRLIVKPIRDIKVGDNSIWGEFVLEETKKILGDYPSLYLSGQEKVRESWFYGLAQAKELDEISIHKTDDICASDLRRKLIECSDLDIKTESTKYLECLEKIPKEIHVFVPLMIKRLKMVANK